MDMSHLPARDSNSIRQPFITIDELHNSGTLHDKIIQKFSYTNSQKHAYSADIRRSEFHCLHVCISLITRNQQYWWTLLLKLE